MPDLTFVLGLSGWTEQGWTQSGSFDLLADPAQLNEALLGRVHEQLAARHVASPRALAEELGQTPDTIWRACERLCRQGRAMFDVESRAFRHRELFEQPVDESKLFPPDARAERANEILSQNTIKFLSCEPQETRKTKRLKTPDGPVTREIVYRDWRVTGAVGNERNTEIVISDTNRIIFGTCTCKFFQDHLLGKGPCEHMIALFRASGPLREDLPTSVPSDAPPTPKPTAAEGDDDADEDEDTEEDVDESEEDENDERR
jgi:hypothetical protein